ncbi:hypothetical protein PYW08_006412 [Mythimna loreyi]|uniref:Uncharacterized protein n=1 Tax=Mythimna loreyi TaxID=667449 RepID=A0ACC2QNJ6_9NEOP|nr:hypothetical protein PYW08_006412 [Mythimna loreyi]
MAYHADIIVDENGKTKCGLCKVFIKDSDIYIEDHLKDTEHSDMYLQRLMIQNNIVINGKKISCLLCNQVSDVAEVLHHIDSSSHKGKMSSVKKIIEKDGGLLVLPEDITTVGSKVNCLVCDGWVEFNQEAVKTHIESAKHRRARAIVVQPLNAIFSVEGSSEDLWCKICQVYFENYIEVIFEHVDEDPIHLKNIGKLNLLIKDQNIDIEKYLHDPKEDKALCKRCGIEVPCNIDNLDRHIRGKQHLKNKK